MTTTTVRGLTRAQVIALLSLAADNAFPSVEHPRTRAALTGRGFIEPTPFNRSLDQLTALGRRVVGELRQGGAA